MPWQKLARDNLNELLHEHEDGVEDEHRILKLSQAIDTMRHPEVERHPRRKPSENEAMPRPHLQPRK